MQSFEYKLLNQEYVGIEHHIFQLRALHDIHYTTVPVPRSDWPTSVGCKINASEDIILGIYYKESKEKN